MNKSPRRTLAVMAASAALVGGALAGSASAAPQQAGAAQAQQLQSQVNDYLAKNSEARQVSANKVAFKGGTVTFSAPGQKSSRASSAPSCRHGHLCIVDGRGKRYDFYRCGTYSFYGIGNGTFNNNQTSGTVARFYNRNGSLRWTNRAKSTGTASWTPVWKIKPC